MELFQYYHEVEGFQHQCSLWAAIWKMADLKALSFHLEVEIISNEGLRWGTDTYARICRKVEGTVDTFTHPLRAML